MSIILPGHKSVDVLQPDFKTGTEAADVALSKKIADTLMDVYPGYAWMIRADHKGGVVRICCGEISSSVLSNQQPGMTLHMKNIHDWGITTKKVVRSAGELLERANLPRGKWNGDFPKHVDGLRDHEQPGFTPRIILPGAEFLTNG